MTKRYGHLLHHGTWARAVRDTRATAGTKEVSTAHRPDPWQAQRRRSSRASRSMPTGHAPLRLKPGRPCNEQPSASDRGGWTVDSRAIDGFVGIGGITMVGSL